MSFFTFQLFNDTWGRKGLCVKKDFSCGISEISNQYPGSHWSDWLVLCPV